MARDALYPDGCHDDCHQLFGCCRAVLQPFREFYGIRLDAVPVREITKSPVFLLLFFGNLASVLHCQVNSLCAFLPDFFIRFLGGHFLDRVLGISFFFRFGFGFVFLLSLFDDTHIRLLRLFALPAEGRG
jgi:hypothetical protein